MILKVCGMRDPENIRAIEAMMQEMNAQFFSGAQAVKWLMGFIFYEKSPRFVPEIPSYLPDHAFRTGVFVNETCEEIRRKIAEYHLSYVQLHGKESPSQCSELQQEIQVIKAFSIGNKEDLKTVGAYEGCADLFVFDTKCEGYGGSGQQFEWSILENYQGKTPFLLSGGIGPESMADLTQFWHPMLAGYDLNSKFESAPAWKTEVSLRQFFKELAQAEIPPFYSLKN